MGDCHGCPAATITLPAPRTQRHIVAIVGPPNSGKSTLFNRLTGLRQKVANFPGVTVEHRTADRNLSFISSSSRSCSVRSCSRARASSICSSLPTPHAIPSPTSTQTGMVSAAEASPAPTPPGSTKGAGYRRHGRKTDKRSTGLGRPGSPGGHRRAPWPVMTCGQPAAAAARREELTAQRTQAVCRLHRLLAELTPGGMRRELTANKAQALLARIRPRRRRSGPLAYRP